MSSASPTRTDQLRNAVDSQALQSTIVTPFRFVGFWSAIVLPFAYIPLLFTDLQGPTLTAFLVMLALHVVAIVAGREYNK